MQKTFPFRNWLSAAALLGMSAGPALAQGTAALPAGVTRVTSVEGITEYQLKNGLRVLLFPDQSKPTTTVNITYLVGSRHEGYGESGMAHLLEHMVFKGSTKHPNVPQELTEHGASPNGTTWYDRTNYFETFSASDENLKWALDLESDRMVNSFIAKKDLDSEFSVVRNEFESGENSPSRVLMDRVLSTAYLWHNYGKSTIGSKEDIERVPIDNLKAFYQKYYQPDNAVLLVAGKMDEAKTLGLISQYFGPIARPARTLAPTYTTEPTQDGEREVTLRRTGDTQGLATAYHVPAGSHPDYPALDVLVDVLTNQPSGRLYKALVESKRAASQWGFTPTLHDPGFAYFYAEVRQGRSLDSARTVMMTTLDNVARQAPTAEEVDRAKTTRLKDIELMFQKSDEVGLALSEYIATGDWRLVYLYRDRLRNVTPADVQRVAAAYLKPSNRTVGLFRPEAKPDRAPIPATPDVADQVRGYKGEAAIAAGEAFEATPANIDTRTKRGQEGGVKYALLAKQTRGSSVNLNLRLRYGDEASLSNKSSVASLTAAMLERGTKTRSYSQIRDAFDKAKAQVRIYGDGQSTNVSVQTAKQNLPTVLAVVMDCLRNPTFPAAEFEKLKQERLAGLESQKQEPQALAFNLAQRLSEPYPKGHPFATLPFEEEIAAIKALKVEDVRAFYKNFYGAQAATLAVVGSFDEPALRKTVKSQLGNWKAPQAYARIPLRLFENTATAKAESIQTDDKANAMFVTFLKYALRDDSPEYPALYMANYILGDGFLNSRLATRIRQKEGVSYGVGSFTYADDNDAIGTFGSYAIYNPANSARLEAAYREELERMSKDGVTAEELKAAKSAALQSFQVERSQDAQLARKWSQYLTKADGRSFTYDAELEKRIAALTPEQVSAAAKKYLDYSKLTIVKAGDFMKAAAEVPVK
ncbi:M16 family metallopeptidase [Hymenobacter armeniacus]|uniref:Insulinase family protein n=1 Tax=Hymenobacter armeniacus TaxID=2771358 RepID=A0ABR8JXB1_9BACT|nr:pitrilysin family protein [Hymenobacter armeniacus]MBD2724590.1 insulinase family protein [Hymenobacter armeniacus]